MNNSTHHSALRYAWVSSAILLLPLIAASESNIQTDASSAASGVTARVNFKIVIPKVLYFRVESDPQTTVKSVAIMSNNHNVMLTASARTPAEERTQRSVILSAAARKSIVQDAVCSLRGLPLAPIAATALTGRITGQLICTASLP